MVVAVVVVGRLGLACEKQPTRRRFPVARVLDHAFVWEVTRRSFRDARECDLIFAMHERLTPKTQDHGKTSLFIFLLMLDS